MQFPKLFFAFFLFCLYNPSLYAGNYLDDAKIYLSNGKNQAAIIQLKNHLKDSPDSISGRYLLGMIYIKTGNILLAEKELKKANQLAPNNEQIQLNYSRILLSLKKAPRVISILKNKYTTPETENLRLEVLAYAHLALNQVAQAQSLFQLAISEGYNRANTGLAQIAFNKKNYSKARALLNKVLLEDKNNKRALKLKAAVLNKAGEYKQALLVYHRLIKNNPQQPLFYLQRAVTYLALKQYTRAENDINIILQKEKYEPHANYLMARVKLAQKKYKQAQEAAMKVIATNATHSASILILGITSDKLHLFNQAEKYLTEYLAINPKDTKIQLFLANMYLANNKPEEALFLLKNLQESIDKLNKPETYANQGETLMLLGSAHLALDEQNKGFELLNKARILNPDNPNIRDRLVGEQIRSGDINSAINELEKGSFLDKNTLKNNSILIGSYIIQGQYKKAENTLNTVLLAYPDTPNLYIFQAAIAHYHQNYKKEKESYNQALKIDKQYIPAYMGLAKLSHDDSNNTLAKQYYQLVLTIDKNYITALLALGLINEQENNLLAAEQFLLRAYNKSKGKLQNEFKHAILLAQFYQRHKLETKTLVIADDLLKNYPDTVEALSYMIDTQIALSNLTEAEVYLNKIISNDPQNIKHRLILAQLLAQQDNREEDMNILLDEAFYIDPASPYVLTIKTALQLHNKDYQKALKTAQWITLRFPLLNTGETLEADILWQMKEFKHALQVYQKAYKKEATYPLAIKIANIMIFQNDQEGAIEFLKQESNKQTNKSPLLFQLAKIYQNKGEYKQAIDYYQQVLSQQADNVTVLNNLAWNYYLINDPQALDFARQAYSKQPGSAAITDTYGLILLADKQNKEALNVLKRASDLAPYSKEIRFHLAQAYYANDNKQKASDNLKKILSDKKSFKSRDQAMELLQQLIK